MEAGFGKIDIRKIAVPEDYITELRFFYAATDQHTIREQTGLYTDIFSLDLEYSLILESKLCQIFPLFQEYLIQRYVFF